MWPLDVQYVLHPYITTAERRFNKRVVIFLSLCCMQQSPCTYCRYQYSRNQKKTTSPFSNPILRLYGQNCSNYNLQGSQRLSLNSQRCSNSSRRNRKSSRSDVLHKSAPQVQTRDMLILHIHTTNRTQMSAGCLVCEAHLDHNRIKTEPRTLKLIVQPTRLTDRHRSQYFRDQTLIII